VGEPILVFGRNFGFQASDVLGVFVDGQRCNSTAWQDSTAVECIVPEASDAKKAAAVADSRVLLELSVSVVTAGGQTSLPNDMFAYSGAGNRPFNAPSGVVGYRRIGASSTITLRWLYSDTDLTGTRDMRFYENADAFIIE